MEKSLSIACTGLLFLSVSIQVLAQDQPIFKLPFSSSSNYQFHSCTQGNNGSLSHTGASTKFALDFNTPNPEEGFGGDPEDILAAADGIAFRFDGCAFGDFSCNFGFGNHIKISHGNNLFTIYAHLETIRVNNQAIVRQGNAIGKEGSTGQSFNAATLGRADHIHFGLQMGDPTALHPGASIPIQQIEVIDKSANSGVRIISGDEFVCGIPTGHIYNSTNNLTPLPGDLNGDGRVNSIDFSIMSLWWLSNDATADINRDGIVNSIDFSILNSNWAS